jgi:HAD superfamily hydrolase (TIGR01509 family)
MSSLEWSRYMHDALGVEPAAPEISEAVVARVERLYRSDLPLIDGAREVVLRLAEVWPLGLASSANRSVIDLVLDLADLSEAFAATLSSEEVPHGKPAPDVYLEAARRLAAPAPSCAAIEDSASGLRSASAAGMTVVAIPNHDFPPEEDSLGLADRVLDSIRELTPGVVRRVAEDRLNS